MYSIDGKVAVDHICRFEIPNEELAKDVSKLGIKDKLDLPRANTGYRSNPKTYRDYYNDDA